MDGLTDFKMDNLALGLSSEQTDKILQFQVMSKCIFCLHVFLLVFDHLYLSELNYLVFVLHHMKPHFLDSQHCCFIVDLS